MTKPANNPSDEDASEALKREIEKALASGISKRTPEQIRTEFRERSIIAGIERGRADMKAGNTVPHEAAMAEVDALIDGYAGRISGTIVSQESHNFRKTL